jgi:hypothetical protein
MYAYQEAEALLEYYPSEYSQALLGTAMLVSETDEEQTPEAIEESIAKGILMRYIFVRRNRN